MRLKESLICLLVILHCSYAPPVSQDKSKEQDSEIKDDLVIVNYTTLYIYIAMYLFICNDNNKFL